MFQSLFRRKPRSIPGLAAFEDAAKSDPADHSAAAALIEFVLTTPGSLKVSRFEDFVIHGEVILDSAMLDLSTQSGRTVITHVLSIDEAGKPTLPPFSTSPLMKIDGV